MRGETSRVLTSGGHVREHMRDSKYLLFGLFFGSSCPSDRYLFADVAVCFWFPFWCQEKDSSHFRPHNALTVVVVDVKSLVDLVPCLEYSNVNGESRQWHL